MSDEHRLRTLMEQAFVTDPPRSIAISESAVRRGYRRRRTMVAAGTAAAVLAVGGVVTVAAAAVGGASRSEPGSTTSGTPPFPNASDADHFAQRVIRDGDLLEASGRVVAIPGKPVRFCGPEEAVRPAVRDAFQGCSFGVDVVGVDLSHLASVRSKDSRTEGYAYLRGTWSGGTLHVSVQTAPRWLPARDRTVSPVDCPVPQGGWHVSPGNAPLPSLLARVQDFADTHPGEVLSQAVARPLPRTNYLVVTVAHLRLAEAALHPIAGELCLLQAYGAAGSLDVVEKPFRSAVEGAPVEALGTVTETRRGVSTTGYPVVFTQAVMMTHQLSDWISLNRTTGALDVTLWLRPTEARFPLPPLTTATPEQGTNSSPGAS